MKNGFAIILTIAVLAIVGFVSIKFLGNKNSEQTFCAQDVEQCPDGSYVQRVPPSCEFAQCTTGTSTATSSGASIIKSFFDAKQKVGFQYPDNFYYNNELTNYVNPVQWPPELSVSTSTFVCGLRERRTINRKMYCVTAESEGAAGSTYTTYTYKLPVDKKTVGMTFIIRMPQCMNYDEPKQSECKDEEKNFDIDGMMDRVFSTVSFQ